VGLAGTKNQEASGMKVSLTAASVLVLLLLCPSLGAEDKPAPEIRVLITTGGHGFDAEGFFGMFRAMPGLNFETIELPKQAEVLEPGLRQRVDCLVLYDMVGSIPENARERLIALLQEGIGVVALHHNLGAHRNWDEYRKIIGGKFIFEPCEIDGQKYTQTSWAHAQKLRILIADPEHPITRGISDFEVEDETYGRFYVAPGVHVLLRTDHPQNNPVVAWTTRYGKSPVVYIQLGHDRGAYDNPNYRQLVHRAILWTSGKMAK
jgi:type 1 glutamine amidotransferase